MYGDSKEKKDEEDQERRVCHVDPSKSLSYEKPETVRAEFTEEQQAFGPEMQDLWL